MSNKTIEEKLNEGRSYRDVHNFEIRTASDDDSQKIVEGYATTFNEPYELFQWDDWDGYRVHFLSR